MENRSLAQTCDRLLESVKKLTFFTITDGEHIGLTHTEFNNSVHKLFKEKLIDMENQGFYRINGDGIEFIKKGGYQGVDKRKQYSSKMKIAERLILVLIGIITVIAN